MSNLTDNINNWFPISKTPRDHISYGNKIFNKIISVKSQWNESHQKFIANLSAPMMSTLLNDTKNGFVIPENPGNHISHDGSSSNMNFWCFRSMKWRPSWIFLPISISQMTSNIPNNTKRGNFIPYILINNISHDQISLNTILFIFTVNEMAAILDFGWPKCFKWCQIFVSVLKMAFPYMKTLESVYHMTILVGIWFLVFHVNEMAAILDFSRFNALNDVKSFW